jgi:hypothetical protein
VSGNRAEHGDVALPATAQRDQHRGLERLQARAAVRARFGYRRLHILIARDGLAVNHKRVHRKSEDLSRSV